MLSILLILASFIHPQEEIKATVYVYQPRHVRTLGKVAPAVFLDDKLIAKLDGTRFFVVKLQPGKHVFRLKDKKRGGVEMGFEANKTYYIRMDMREGFTVGASGLTVIAPEQGSYEIKQMKPIEKGDIKDPSVVSIPSQ